MAFEEDPLWYKDAIIYELHVRAFSDSNGDGNGDFRGLTERLDYLADLGITALWLLPFYPSPLKDDGYDISDYLGVHSDYGTLKDFKEFLKEARKRNIRVITELVINHTSDQHPWFQRSRHAKPGSRWRDFYVWSDTPEKYKDARIIFKDFETSNWARDTISAAYYWHRFYSHQPDLNFDNPLVRKTVMRILDFWLRMGVSGFRLDAVPYLFEREETNCENLPETYAFLRELRGHVDRHFKNRMLLAEANQWPEDASAYFGSGDIAHMAFHFPLMPRIFIGLQMEDRFPVIDILEQTPGIPDLCQWALFLRNHDELTLEMVTDEERDYMYRVYARDPKARINLGIRRRLAPLMENNQRKMELMNILLFSLPGTPVIYYGDEIGMGDNYYLGDRNGVRTPMQWSPDRNGGFSSANPQRLYLPLIIDPEYHYESINVENQQRNPSSLLWWMKRVIAMRKRFKSLSRGTLEFLFPENTKIFSFLRRYGEESILVITNLSRYFQVVELDLSKYSGFIPEEVSSHNRFPIIKESPYVLTLGPHSHLLLLLKKEEEKVSLAADRPVPELRTMIRWETVLEGENRRRLEEEILPRYLRSCRWFGGKARRIVRSSIIEEIPMWKDSDLSYTLILSVSYTEGPEDFYLLPVTFAPTRKADEAPEELIVEGLRVRIDYDWMTLRAKLIMEEFPQAIIARLFVGGDEGILFDAVYDGRFREFLFDLLSRRRKMKGSHGELMGIQGKMFKRLHEADSTLFSQVVKAEQSNTSIFFGEKFYFKLFRILNEGTNPDQEITQFLTERAGFLHVPPFAGSLEYRRHGSAPVTIGLLQGYVHSEGDSWKYTVDALGRYFEQVLSKERGVSQIPKGPALPFMPGSDSFPSLLRELIEGHYLEMIGLLGRRTGEMHLALSSSEEEGFAPEPFSMLYQRSVYQSMRGLVRQVFQLLRRGLKALPKDTGAKAERMLAQESKVLDQMKAILQKKFSSVRVRIHGDYHLGQVLFTGKDFLIIDFEGEPARPLSERKFKRSPLRDVAGMIRSFHYAAYFALLKEVSIRSEDIPVLEPWANLWYRSVSAIFLRSYLETVGQTPLIPAGKEDCQTMLKAFLLDKAVYELGYELNNRPEWVIIPLQGIKDLIGGD